MKAAAGAEDMTHAVSSVEMETGNVPVAPSAVEHAPAEPVSQPQVVIDQVRLQQEAETLNARYQERRAAEARHVEHAAPEPQPAPEKKGGFSLFGRRRKPVDAIPKTAPVASAEPVSTPPQEAPASAPRPPTGDLFGDSLDEGDLEIPAFLRRQAN